MLKIIQYQMEEIKMKKYKEIEEVIYLGNKIEDVYNNFQLFKNCGKDIMNKQGHSGMSHHLECSIISTF